MDEKSIYDGRLDRMRDEQMKAYCASRDSASPTTSAPSGASQSYGPPPSPGLTEDTVDEAFRYHPWSEDQNRAGTIVVEVLIAAAKAILRNVPACPDRSAALRKLREARMDANSAITHRGRF